MRRLLRCFTPLILLLVATTASARETPDRPYLVTEEREPCADFDPLRRPFFGDTHVHTAYSFDANSQDTRNTPADAYRFARGEPMGIQPYDENDQPLRTIQLDRPLDFTAISDHSEFLGEIRYCTEPGGIEYWHPVCIVHRSFPQYTFATLAAYGLAGKRRWELGLCGSDGQDCLAKAASVWQEIQQHAENAYDRSSSCTFSSFVGYEWTASVGSGQNLHHNVVFRNEHVPDYPMSWIESPSQVQLWDYLDRECVAGSPGCDAVVIPHNSNLSGGLMFETARVETEIIPEEPVTADEAARRARWNVLFELMQHKGSSECDSRTAWAADEFCDFEKMGYDSFGGKNTGMAADGNMEWMTVFVDSEALPVTKPPEPSNFLRYGLLKGLEQQALLGVNSFRFGLISSTDTHIAAPGLATEKDHPGHGGAGMGSGEGLIQGLPDELEYGPGGLAVLWAEENSRDALFAAMQRREAYATSGTRPILRFFGGWDYPQDLCDNPDMVKRGYEGGVPMGGEMSPAPSPDAQPHFVISALADTGSERYPGTPLQRVQLIKGWYKDGNLQEKVLDVAGGPNSASVDINTCEPSGAGHSNLCTVWRDDDFDPSAQAFYYTRVLENPSCRWSQHICSSAGVRCDDPATVTTGFEQCCAAEHKPIQQERAWSSPIWYVPPAP